MSDLVIFGRMERKLTWHEIREQFDQEWVQLIDFDWPEGEPFPASGIVQFHAPDRKQFDMLSRQNPIDDAACVFVGKAHLPAHTFLSANAMKIRDANSQI